MAWVIAGMKEGEVFPHTRAGQALEGRAVMALGEALVVLPAESFILVWVDFEPFPDVTRRAEMRHHVADLAPLAQVPGQSKRLNPHSQPVVGFNRLQEVLDLDH